MAKRQRTDGRQGRRIEREEHWRKIIVAQAASGLTHTEFCKQQGISPHSYFWWKRELRVRAEQRRSQASATKLELRKGRTSRSPFVAVKISQPEVNAPALEVVLSGGRVVRVPGGFDAESLKRLLAVLEDSSC